MSIKTYLLAAIVFAIAAITGSDLVAHMTIAGDTFGEAIVEHFRWASLTAFGVALLLAPFGGTALICGATSKYAKSRGVLALFLVAMATLVYFYFNGFQASQQAMIDRRWTAAALSIGLLPFFVGLPLLGVVAIVGVVIAKTDRRQIVD